MWIRVRFYNMLIILSNVHLPGFNSYQKDDINWVSSFQYYIKIILAESSVRYRKTESTVVVAAYVVIYFVVSGESLL